MAAGFEDFDAHGALGLEARMAGVSPDARAKGFFLQRVVDEARRHSGRSVRQTKYLPFKDYPSTEWISLLADGAAAAYPRQPIREALRRLGHGVFESYRESVLGKVILSVAGNSLEATIPLVPKFYEVSSTHGSRVVVAVNEPGRCVVELHDAWDFGDCYHVGVLEGGFLALSRPVRTRVRTLGLDRCDVEFRYV